MTIAYYDYLNSTETQILALWAISLTVKDTARCLRMSVRAVNYYRSKLRLLLRATQSSELINHVVNMEGYEELIHLGRQLVRGEVQNEV